MSAHASERAGPYRLLSRIEAGVSLAQDHRGRRAVIKLHAAGEGERLGLAEADLLGLRHPGLAACLDVGRLPGSRELYTATEPIRGEPLAPGAWSARPPHDGVLLTARLLSALSVLHGHGLLHRDLKPGNVLLEAGGRPVVLDFGLSCPVDGRERLDAAGTPRAMAPELFRGGAASVASDLWSAGLLLAEALLGEGLFRGSDPEAMTAERLAFRGLPPRAAERLGDRPLASLLARMLSPDPAARPRDAASALAALPPLAPEEQAELARDACRAALSAAIAGHDARRRARLAAARERRLWVEGLGEAGATLDEAVQEALVLARQVEQPDPSLAARIAAAEQAPRLRPVDYAGLLEGLASLGPLVVGLGGAPEELRTVLSRLLGATRGVETFIEPRLDGDAAAAVLQAWLGARPALERRLRDSPPEHAAGLEDSLSLLLRMGVVRAEWGAVSVRDGALPAHWPLPIGDEPPLELPADASELLGLLASCSRPLEPGACEEALGRPLRSACAALRERGLLRRERGPTEDRFAPADARLRRAVRPASGPVRDRLALALARRHPAGDGGLDESVAEAVGELLVAPPGGGADAEPPRNGETLELLVAAGDALRRGGRVERAATLLDEGLRRAGPASPLARRLHLDRVDVLIRAGEHQRALAAVSEARAVLGREPALDVREARVMQLRGRALEAIAVLEHLDPDRLPREDALLGLQVRATARQAAGDLHAALADAREGIRRAGEADDRRTMALLERTASLEEKLGHFDDATRHYEACIAMARRLGHELLIGSPLYNMGRAIRQRGEKRRGLQLQEEGARRMEAAGDLVNLAAAQNGLGAGWLLLGRVDTARRHLARALALAERLDDQTLAGMALNNLARALAAEGRHDEAEECFARSLSLRASRGDVRGEAAVAITRGRVRLARGREGEAAADLVLARERLAGLTAPEWEVEAALLEAGLALHRGEREAAAGAAGRAAALAERHAFGSERLRAADLLARAGAGDLEAVDAEREERGAWLADLLFTRAVARLAAGREAEGDADTALALSILGETPDGPVEARGLLLRLRADLERLDRLLSRPEPDYGKVGERLARIARDLERARALVEMHDLGSLREPLRECARRHAVAGEEGDVSGLAALAERLRNLERLAEINKALNTEHDTQRLLELIVDSAIELTGAARGFLILFDGRAEEFRAARNIDESTIHHPEFEVSHSVARRVVKEGQAMLTANAIDDPRLSSAASISQLKLLSILCVPLVSRERTLGAIYLDHPQVVGRFDERHLGTVTALAEQAAIALENARLSEGLASSNSALRASREEVARLNEALEARLVEREAELETVRESLDASRRALALRYDYSAIVTCSPKMHDVLDLMDRITDTDFPVIILGESGTGKELIARAFHFNGPRRERNFVSLNCAAIAEPLIESELFGSVRGAFTGADRDRKGLFEQAHGGTLFLDEIGDMSPSVQKRLLRVLQEGEFLPVGGREARKVDVRVLCATHRDLRKMVSEGSFREDLYYRLAVAKIALPPLRERAEDIGLLLPHFLARHGGAAREIEPEALAVLRRQPWPGNVRELENFVMNLLLFDRSATPLGAALVRRILAAAGAPEEVLDEAGPETEAGAGDGAGERGGASTSEACRSEDDTAEDGGLRVQVEAFERRQLARALAEAQGNKAQAARRLGVSVRTLYKMLERLGLGSKES